MWRDQPSAGLPTPPVPDSAPPLLTAMPAGLPGFSVSASEESGSEADSRRDAAEKGERQRGEWLPVVGARLRPGLSIGHVPLLPVYAASLEGSLYARTPATAAPDRSPDRMLCSGNRGNSETRSVCTLLAPPTLSAPAPAGICRCP